MQSKSTKKSLVASGLSLLVCAALLIGTTFAWFTDSVSNTGNKIEAGTLNVSLSEWDKEAGKYVEVGVEPIFNSTLWEPGYTDIAAVKIGNEGTLALKYELDIIASGATDLAEVIDVYYYRGGVVSAENGLPENITALKESGDYVNLGTLDKLLADEDNNGVANGHLEAGTADFAIIALHMQETAGNEYQGASIGSSFDIVLNATQYNSETDGFNNPDYDKDASYKWDGTADTTWYDASQTVYSLSTAEEFAGFAELVNDGTSFDGKTIQLTENMNFGGKSFQTINGSRMGALTLDGGGHTISNVQFDGYTYSSSSQRYGGGLFGQVNSDLTVKNLTIEYADATTDRENAEGTGAVGIVCGYVYGNATFENVHIRNCEVTADQKCGGMVGFAAGIADTTISFKDCSVSGMIFNTQFQCANFVGYAGAVGNQAAITYDNVETAQGTVNPILYYSKEDLAEVNGRLYILASDVSYAFDVTGLHHNLSYGVGAPTIEVDGVTYTVFDTSVVE